MSVRSQVVNNAVWMFAAEIVDKLCGPLLLFLFARIFGSLVLGEYSFVLSYVAFAFMLSDLGTTVYAIRECARKPKQLTFYLSHAAAMRLVLTGLAISALLLSLLFIDKPHNVVIALLVFTASTALANLQNVFEITFYSRNNLKTIAIGRMIERLALFAFGLFAMLVAKNFILFVAGHLFAQTLHFAWIFLNSRKFAKPALQFDWVVWKRFIAVGTPIALTSFLFFVYFRIDILMLSFLRGDQEVGWYSAAYRILDLVQFFPYILSYSVFPALLQLHKKDQKLADVLFTSAARLLLLIAMPITYGIFLLAPLIVALIYGADFLQTIPALRVMILIVPFLFLDSLFRYVVYTVNKEWRYLWTLLVLALFNTALNFIFIPQYGLVAAAWTTLASEALGFVLFYLMVRSGGFSLHIGKTLFSVFRALIAAFLVFWAASWALPLTFATLASLLAYGLVLLLVEFDQGDKDLLRDVTGGVGRHVAQLCAFMHPKNWF
jgi:O-antigen/teichoic acid export membrane protein